MARLGRAQPFAPKIRRFAPQGAAIGASAALTEAADSVSGSCRVALGASASLTEAADGAAGALAVRVTGGLALGEAADLLAGNASTAGPAVVDPNYLISLRPRARRAVPDARARVFRARFRLRNILAAKRA